ncbi:MAG: glycosyltransferase [Candidatus Thermoplasmatota archaeon]|nr:glycosyltransferase [Candidatus Thermoplasmatota archaeon]
MKISFVAPAFKYSTGTKTYLDNLIHGFKQLDVDTSIHYLHKLEFSILGKPRFGVISQMIQGKFVRVSGDIIHSISPSNTIKDTNVITIHDVIPFLQSDKKPSIWDRRNIGHYLSIKKALRVNDIVVTTKFTKQKLIELFGKPENNIHMVPAPIRTDFFKKTPNNPYPEDGKIHALSISDFNPRKNLKVVVGKIGGSSDIEFYHIGSPRAWSSQYEDLMAFSKSFNNVHILGAKSSEELVNYLSHADVLISMSESEGFGLVVAEALSCGVPVLLNPISVYKELYGSIANFVTPETLDGDIVIKTASQNKDPNALMDYAEQFSTINVARKMLEVYDKIYKEKGSYS